MAEDAFSLDSPVAFVVDGEAGDLPASQATPLAVVLTELLQNAVEHGYPEGSPGGTVKIVLRRDAAWLHVVVQDDGKGLPPGFSLEKTRSLGLSIARDLVQSQLQGTFTLTDEGGAKADLRIPIGAADV
jgi:two-component sensor histidine kinase